MPTLPKSCFVIGPIGARDSRDRKHADTLLRSIIRPTFRAHFREFKVERADHMSRPGMIDSQIITALFEADLVIADLTTRNANAFYELGIRHVLQKPVIHVFKRGERIPMDIAPFRAVEFSYRTPFDIRDAKILLRKTIVEAISTDYAVENPVTRSAGFVRMRERVKARGVAAPLASGSNGSGSEQGQEKSEPESEELDFLHIAPGLIFRRRPRRGEAPYQIACWQASEEAKMRGFRPTIVPLWRSQEWRVTRGDKKSIYDQCVIMQEAMDRYLREERAKERRKNSLLEKRRPL